MDAHAQPAGRRDFFRPDAKQNKQILEHIVSMLHVVVPILFVLIWSTGFVVARGALPHADLQLFLLIRLSITAVIMATLALLVRGAWPRGKQIPYQILTGVLLQGVYLCFSYWAITHGMAAGIMALLGALQPLFTALIVVLGGKRLAYRTWSGLIIGFAGVTFVLWPKLMASSSTSLPVMAVIAALLSVLGVTIGALLQKSLANADLRAASSLQNVGGVAVALLMTLATGTGQWDGTPQLWGALAWSVIVASVIGLTLLLWMLRHGDATKVAALILLVPPLASLQAYVFFKETLTPMQFSGFALALFGVVLARRT